MTLQNRVLPTAEIVAVPARGTMMGNRGILHRADRTLGRARWRHKAWICCVLRFKGRARAVMAPGTYTELFFLDEATALAAGHRPCAECRRAPYLAFRAALARAGLAVDSAPALDALLHGARLDPQGRQARPRRALRDVPAGAVVLWDGAPHLVAPAGLLPFAPSGYGPPRPLTGGAPEVEVSVLTPWPTCAALAAGYTPLVHPSAHP